VIRSAFSKRSSAIFRDLMRPATLSTAVLFSGCAGGTAVAPNVQQCAEPNVAARQLKTAVPVESPVAVQEGIYGQVKVLVGLDATSKVVSAVVESSPSVLLNSAAIDAARNSSYATEISGCVPIASNVIFTATFDPMYFPAPGP
jgi:hypothetical protein